MGVGVGVGMEKRPSAFEHNERPSLPAWEACPVSECTHRDWWNAAVQGDLECIDECAVFLENPHSKLKGKLGKTCRTPQKPNSRNWNRE